MRGPLREYCRALNEVGACPLLFTGLALNCLSRAFKLVSHNVARPSKHVGGALLYTGAGLRHLVIYVL